MVTRNHTAARSFRGRAVLLAIAAAGAGLGCVRAPVGGTVEGTVDGAADRVVAESADAERRAALTAMIDANREDFPDVPMVDAAQVATLLETPGVVVVDAREPEEQAVSMIPGAITVEQFEAEAERYRTARVVTYCTVGYRSAEYTRLLRSDGWDAVNFAGSILAWTHAGGELVDPAGRETRRVHVYGKRWNLAPNGFEPVW